MLNPKPFPEIHNAGFQFCTPASGGHMRYTIIEPEGETKGTFLIVPGRRECIEKKFFEMGDELLARGYKLIFFEPRGQGGSSRFLAHDPKDEKYQRDYLPNADAPINDLRGFYRDVVKPNQKGPLYVFAHSMGALAVTRWLAEGQENGRPPDVKAAILSSPAYALSLKNSPDAKPYPSIVIYLAALAATLFGRGADYAPGFHDYDQRDKAFEKNELSQDYARFKAIGDYFAANEALKVGGVTWRWLLAAVVSTWRLTPAHLKRIKTPILALLGGADTVTPPDKILKRLRNIPNAETVVIPSAWHEVMNEADGYRMRAWECIDRFLAPRAG